jgi:hypothetical protein
MSMCEGRSRAIFIATIPSLSIVDSSSGCTWHEVMVCRRSGHDQWKWPIAGYVSCCGTLKLMEVAKRIDRGVQRLKNPTMAAHREQ